MRTPDGAFLIFCKFFQVPPYIVRMRAEGSQIETVVANDKPGSMVPTSLSADGTLLAFTNVGDVFVRDEKGDIRAVLKSGASESDAQFAPDGRWLAYVSNETGRSDVFVQPYPPDVGRELFFKRGNDLIAVPVELNPAFTHGPPALLFNRPLAAQRFAVTADAQRFLVLARDENAPPPAPSLRGLWLRRWRSLLRAPRCARSRSRRSRRSTDGRAAW